jgi:hypothetical protein
MDKSQRRLSAWSRVSIAENDDGEAFQSGDVCRLAGSKGQYRIIGIDQHRSGIVEMTLRRELRGKVGRTKRVDIEDVRYVEPPYRAVY